MPQPTSSEQVTLLRVRDVNQYIKWRLEGDSGLTQIWITGEVQNCRLYQAKGHLYFTLTDGDAQLNCVVYANYLSSLDINIKNGMSIQALGSIKTFHKRGTYSFQVVFLRASGAGDQHQALAKLKETLRKEGRFDPERKIPLPRLPQRVAMITAPGSAAMWDFVTIIQAKAPMVSLCLIPAVMQGPHSSSSVMHGFLMAQKAQPFDLIVLLRGGGAAEDLASFNDADLVRFISDYASPVITAIGHEVDYTLCDFVADVRCETPTAAAQLIVEQYQTYITQLRHYHTQIDAQLQQQFRHYQLHLQSLHHTSQRQLHTLIEQSRTRLSQLGHRLGQANPLHKFDQGFSICSNPEGQALSSIDSVRISDTIQTQFQDGHITSTVTQIKKDAKWLAKK